MDNNSINKNEEDCKEDSSATQGDTVNIPPISDNLPPQDSCINIPSLSDNQNAKECFSKDNVESEETISQGGGYNYENSVNNIKDKNCEEDLGSVDNVSAVHNPYNNVENVEFNKSEFSENPYHFTQQKIENPQNCPPQDFNNPYANGFKQTVPPQNFNNPYANPEDMSQSQTTIEYIPYVPGKPLSNGVTPQFINGGWYYPVVRLAQPKKKKMATSVKAFLSVIVALTLAFIVLLIVWCANLGEGNSSVFDFNDGNGFTFELPTESGDSSGSSGEVGKYADPNGPEISLEKNNTLSGSTEKAYEALSDSVVSVAVYDKGCNPANDASISEGTGIILTSDGYMVTNSHVINDSAESNVYVTTKDGKVFSALVVGCDTRTDIAVLKSDDAVNWKPASFADSKQLKVGQDVVAIGSPGGASYSHSITRGIISALDRTLSGSAVSYIQTDAAINPGNSGGPLANLNGQVVGINTIKVVDTEYEGMGFAIPSVTVKEIADQLIKNGYVKGRARMGIVGREVSEETAKILGGEAGICIESIDDDSPLKDTKVKEGDIITKIDDTSIASFNELFSTLDSYNIGDTVTLSIYRRAEDATKKDENFTVKITLLGENE